MHGSLSSMTLCCPRQSTKGEPRLNLLQIKEISIIFYYTKRVPEEEFGLKGKQDSISDFTNSKAMYKQSHLKKNKEYVPPLL